MVVAVGSGGNRRREDGTTKMNEGLAHWYYCFGMRKKGAALLRHPPPFPEDLFVAQIVGWFVLSIASRPT